MTCEPRGMVSEQQGGEAAGRCLVWRRESQAWGHEDAGAVRGLGGGGGGGP